MFATTKQRSSISSALNMSRLVFHSVVRKIRQSHRIPLMSIFSSILQTVLFVLAFLLMFDMLGMRGAAIRGDFVLYIMSGIFLVIDQARGYTFINYVPRNSNLEYPFKLTLAFVFIGLIVQYYTNKRVSDSWSARG